MEKATLVKGMVAECNAINCLHNKENNCYAKEIKIGTAHSPPVCETYREKK